MVEGVVYGGMDDEKTLRGSRRLEPLHLALSSPHDLMHRGRPSRFAGDRHAGFSESWRLMSYSFDTVEVHAQGASCIDRILKGASPADLPVQQPIACAKSAPASAAGLRQARPRTRDAGGR